jgi:hypothetical protein
VEKFRVGIFGWKNLVGNFRIAVFDINLVGKFRIGSFEKGVYEFF